MSFANRARLARQGKKKKYQHKVVKALHARKRKVSNVYCIDDNSLTIANQAKLIKKLRQENKALKTRITKLVNNNRNAVGQQSQTQKLIQMQNDMNQIMQVMNTTIGNRTYNKYVLL